MSALKEYVAIQDFTMSLDNGKTPLNVKRGETLEFDGLNVVFRGEQGTARPLVKVVGEWIAPIGIPAKPVEKQLAVSSRNASGGRIVEHSDYPSDPIAGVKNQHSDNLNNLLKNFDKMPEVKIVNGKREVTGDLEDIKREVTIINEDANEVRKVTANDGAAITNKNSVELGKNSTSKGSVMSQEGQVAKATNYTGKEASTGERKKLTIDYEASGVIVKKTTSRKTIPIKSTNKMETVATDINVGETSYPSIQTTDVGSSTQAQVEQNKTFRKAPVKKGAAKKAPAKRGTTSKTVSSIVPENTKPLSTAPTVAKGAIISTDGQEAVVIGKIKRDSSSKIISEDGIISKVTVGAPEDMSVGEVQFASNNDYDDPGVVISASEDTIFDASDTDDIGVNIDSMTDEAQVIEAADDDIDLNSLLSED
jgi:hypothetical protein